MICLHCLRFGQPHRSEVNQYRRRTVDKESDVACSLELVMVIFSLPATLIAMVIHERILRTDFVPVNVISFTHNLLKDRPPYCSSPEYDVPPAPNRTNHLY
jgi:hypothetical protein